MASKENKMRALQEFGKSIRRGEGGAAIPKLLYYLSNPTPVAAKTSTVSKPKPVKYASIGKSQMRSGRSSTIKTSSYGVLNKLKTKKKTLLGS